MSVRSVRNKSFDQNKLSESFRFRLESVRDRRKIVIWKVELYEKNTALTRYAIRNNRFHAPFLLLLIRKWKQQLLLHLPFHSHYSYCEVHMSAFQCSGKKRWLECHWKSQLSFVYYEKDSMSVYFSKIFHRVSLLFFLCPCLRFFMKIVRCRKMCVLRRKCDFEKCNSKIEWLFFKI